jgi:O-antigen/teichoic acid export membrane protein
LGFVSNPTSVAIYTTAHKLVFAAQGLYSPITTAMFPRISLNYAKSHDMAVLTIKKLLKVTSILGGVTSISIITLAPHAINLLFGEGYEQSIVVMMILSPLPLVVSLGNVLGIQTLIVFGYKKQFMNAVLYVGMFSLIFLIPISYYWQSYGAAICVVFSELLISLSMLYLVKKNKILI